MSQPSPSVFHVNQTGEEQYDIEHIDAPPPPAQSNPPPADGDEVIVVHESDVDEGSHSHGITSIMSKVKKTTAAACVMGFCAVVAVALGGIAEHNRRQQQNALAAINVVGGKAGKSFSFCEPVIECGATFINEEVVLSHDIICSGPGGIIIPGARATATEQIDISAAITLSGPNASIDCKGHTIRQANMMYGGLTSFSPDGDGEEEFERPNFANPFEPRNRNGRKAEMKENLLNEPNLDFFEVGILLIDGATATNCKVERFLGGFLVLNGGEVKKSETSGNQYGIFIEDETGSIETKVSDV